MFSLKLHILDHHSKSLDLANIMLHQMQMHSVINMAVS